MKKRLLIYGVNYYPPKGGTSTVVENLVLQLKEQYDITVYCYSNPLAKTHIDGVKVVEFKQLAKGSLGSLLYFFLSALHILFTEKTALVSAHKTDCAIFIPLLRLRFKVVATSHEAPYKRDKWNFFQKLYFKFAERIFIKTANVCTCISEPLCWYYEEKYGKQVYFIPNGINVTDESNFDKRKAASFLPDKADINQPFILFSARRLMGTKGCHTLLEALTLLKHHGQVFIAGELEQTPYLDKLKELAKDLNVSFIGFVTPLNALLALVNSSQLFVFPSETEGMSIMLLEVASVGKPIIASDIPENTQIFSTSEVLYFESGNVADLAEKIGFALSENVEMAAMGGLAKDKVTGNYLWSDIAQKYLQVFSSASAKTIESKNNS